jgi:Rrf2 family protein
MDAMRLSTRSTYGMRALIELALASGRGPVSAAYIAKRQGLSVAYLEQLLHRLKRRNLIGSVRGPRGGYVLGRHPGQITMAEVVQILDGDVGGWNGTERGTLDENLPMQGKSRTFGNTATSRLSKTSARSRPLPHPARSSMKGEMAAAVADEARQHAQRIAFTVWRCIHDRLKQSLGGVTLQDLCDEVRMTAGRPLDHRYVFHI